MSQVDNRNSSAAKRARTDGLPSSMLQAVAGKMIGPALAVEMSTFHLEQLAICVIALSQGQLIITP
ncbi:hypothetical protein L484_015491 [Morus notabilis]|uniref:Uncharacterized protein n=1 Tax=Morus notabilis TaxID=981085 RepID=W9S829_9ROSA|nr:hypothetical protein L484_015491 [Morus notabilis]